MMTTGGVGARGTEVTSGGVAARGAAETSEGVAVRGAGEETGAKTTLGAGRGTIGDGAAQGAAAESPSKVVGLQGASLGAGDEETPEDPTGRENGDGGK